MTRFSSSSRIMIAGVFVDTLTEDDVIERVTSFVKSGECHQIITANPLMIMAAEKDSALRAAFDEADLVIPDSVGVLWAARLKGHLMRKMSGIDLMEKLCEQAAVKGWRVYFLGAGPGVAEDASRRLLERHQNLKIAGVHHGYFSSSEEELIHAITASKPDLLFVGLSTPFQDGWIHKNLARLGAKVVMGVGGSFDVLSGRLFRAPKWMRATGLEWLFRLLQEPRRFFRMVRLPFFALKIFAIPQNKTHL